MRVCLQCDSEYLDDPPVCRSCGADTVTVEEARLQHELRERLATEDLVVVTNLEGPVDESILVGLLEEANIPCTIRGGTHGAFPGVDRTLPMVGQLLVAEEDLDEAARIVRHYRNNVVVDSGEDIQDAPTG